MPTNTAAPRVRFLYNRLLKHFGPQGWWLGSSWEMMVGAILVQNTAWTNVKKALDSLRRAKALNPRTIARMSRRRLEQLIRPSGYFRQKAHRLQLFARRYVKDPSFIHDRTRLLAQHGVGPETADSILLYASQQPVFVVDAYTRRIGQRVGLFKTNDYDRVQAFFQERLPRDTALYNEFHALLVKLAKTLCLKHEPRCAACPLRRNCAYGRKRT